MRVLVAPAALMHVVGTTMDYVENRLRAEFVFQNPRATGTCGCGESFTTDAPAAAACAPGDGAAAAAEPGKP